MEQVNEKLRLGMIGGGEGAFIGAVHRSAAALDGQIELVCGAFSRNPDNNRRSGRALGLEDDRVYGGWRELIEAEAALPSSTRAQVLTIATPNHLHVPIAEAALAAGFHVFSEKPAGISLAEVQRLRQAVADSDCHYALAHTYLGYPLVQQAREMVATRQIGRLRKIYVEYCQGWLAGPEEQRGNKQAGWRTDPALAGGSGCMADIGTHAFGLAEFIGGQPITHLCAELRSHVDERQLDDDGAMLFRTADGASGVLVASQVCAGEENNFTIRLYGERGGLEWRQMEPNSLIHREAGGSIHTLRAGSDHRHLYHQALRGLRLPGGHPEGYLEAMANLYRDFASTIRGDTRCNPVPGIEEGARGLAFIESALASGGKWVEIDSVTTAPRETLA